jgi:hypothetical protein
MKGSFFDEGYSFVCGGLSDTCRFVQRRRFSIVKNNIPIEMSGRIRPVVV